MRQTLFRAIGLVAMVVALVGLQLPAFGQNQIKPTPVPGGPPGLRQQQPPAPAATTRIRTLLITGHNNHNWQYTSRVHADTLEATGRFQVDITDDPATFMADAKNLDPYDLFVVDYNDGHAPKRWGPEAEKNFESRVRLGAGVVTVHAANNAFPQWPEWRRMIALVWQEGTSSHDAFGEFDLQIPGTNVITSRFPKSIKVTDELYYGLVGTARYSNLAHAVSAKTGKAETLVATTEYANSRICNISLGHVWENQPATKYTVTSPFFRILLARACEWAGANAWTLPWVWQDVRQHNTLSEAERAAGWTLLFDGVSATGWRGFKNQAFPGKGWSVKGGELVHAAGGGGGDIITNEQFGDFELSIDWKVAPGGNSGIMYRCAEDKDYPWQTGPECQVLDDERHNDGKNRKTSAGSLYDVVAPPVDVVRPAGEWNTTRIVARGTKIEHWLNGFKVVDIDLASEEFAKAKAASKWKDSAEYASKASGHIALQDHGDEVRYRNIKVRKLP